MAESSPMSWARLGKLYIGVDGGGTKTRAACAFVEWKSEEECKKRNKEIDDCGKLSIAQLASALSTSVIESEQYRVVEISSALSGATNHNSVGKEKARRHVEESIKTCLSSASLKLQNICSHDSNSEDPQNYTNRFEEAGMEIWKHVGGICLGISGVDRENDKGNVILLRVSKQEYEEDKELVNE